MPALEDLDRDTPALLWCFRRYDGEGNVVVGDVPERLDARWVDRTRFVRTPDGQTVQTDASVAVVRGEAVPMNSLMFRGTPNEYTAGTELTVMQVVTRSEATDVKGRVTRREYGLAYYRGKLPTVTGP